MKILLCGKKEECFTTSEYIKAQFPNTKTIFCDDADELLMLLRNTEFDIAMVEHDGAEGMETVMTLRRQLPNLPVVWLSNDSGFAVQSYRIGAAYFHSKPVTDSVVVKAINQCRIK